MGQTEVPDLNGSQIGLPGQLQGLNDADVITARQADTTPVPMGTVVARGTVDPANDAILPAASSADLLGIVLHSHHYPRLFGDLTVGLGSAGLTEGATLNVLRKGQCYVIAEQTVTAGDRGFVRFSANGVGKLQLGAIRKDSDGSGTSAHAIDAKARIQFMTSALAGELVLVDVDFLNQDIS